MFSFDFAANLELPILINTPGSFYFSKRRTNALLGFTQEENNFQYNFLFDEFDSKNFAKGSNMIFSSLFWLLNLMRQNSANY